MRSFIALFSLMILSISAAQACDIHFKSEDLCMSVSWEKFPKARENGAFVLKFTDAQDSQRLMDPKTSPHVILWMTSMGHGSKPVTLKREDIGTFRSTDVFFIMGGPWDIKFQLKDGDNVLEERVKGVRI